MTSEIDPSKLVLHLHDTFGRAAECVRVALQLGMRSFDGSAAGLGGCPYASTETSRAPGNIATDLLVRTIKEAGYETGVDAVASVHLSLKIIAMDTLTPPRDVGLAVYASNANIRPVSCITETEIFYPQTNFTLKERSTLKVVARKDPLLPPTLDLSGTQIAIGPFPQPTVQESSNATHITFVADRVAGIGRVLPVVLIWFGIRFCREALYSA